VIRAALYGRVSTNDQTAENQFLELRRYAEHRGWSATEYRDEGVSGLRESRPALDRLVRDAKRRKCDVLLVWRLDRLGRSLKHLIMLLDEFHALGVAFVSLQEGIDATTPAGRLQLHVLGAIAEFERARIVERVRAGLTRARAQGRRLGRPPCAIPETQFDAVAHLSVREAAKALNVSRSVVQRHRASQNPLRSGRTFASEQAGI
jgi:DNA invertase Pin-like site-specific DNA recombinase